MNSDLQIAGIKSKSFPIVAIGASDGGIDAIEELFHHLPAKTGMVYLFIRHAEPGSNNLVEILSRAAQIPVEEIKEAVVFAPDRLYVLPHNKVLEMGNGIIKTGNQVDGLHASMPINQVFTSLADWYKEATIGILFFGSDSDGTLGLKAIRQAGGLTFAHNQSAIYRGMSKNVLSEGAVDLVLSPKEIAEELGGISRKKELFFYATQELSEEAVNNREEDLINILYTLKNTTGVDFSQYKMNTIKRRITRRMILHKLESLKEYIQYLRTHANEIGLLYQDLLINVTYFFRDYDSNDFLKTNVLPQIIKQKSLNEPIRVWVPACSTGQEAYSLAILIVEALGENATNIPVQIFGTDLSELAINKARLGVYSKDDVVGIPPKQLQRFFAKIDGSYRIIKSLRDLCVFATHNIAKDPPFSHLDLISCCNLLIYLDNRLQKKVITTFHYSLNKNGYLILGRSETVGDSSYLFSQLDKKYRIYVKKKNATVKSMFDLNLRSLDIEHTQGMARKNATHKIKADEQDINKIIDALFLKKYTPASVVVNGDLDIVQFRGSTGLYLEPAPGKASLNLMKMARQGLGFELRNLIHKVKKTGEPVRKTGIGIIVDSKAHNLALEIIPIKGDVFEDYYLVVFEPLVMMQEDGQAVSMKDKRVKQLEAELNVLHEDMRSVMEAQEAANEELQSANEEIVSSNEELQSINEELETSKEEIESSNEELITINQELLIRNDQLAESLEYSEAVFSTIRESFLILDRNLRVKTANSTFYKTFLAREEETEGQLIYDLQGSQWNIPKLQELLENILPRNTQFHGFEITHNFLGVGEKTMLFNARKVIQKSHGQEIILLAIEDITEHRQGQKMLAQRESWFRNMADNAPMMIWVVDTRKSNSFFNKAWLKFRGLKLEEAIGRNWFEGVHPDDLGRCIKLFDASFAEKKPFELKYRVHRSDGEYRLVLSKANPNIDHEGEFLGYIGTCVELGEEGNDK